MKVLVIGSEGSTGKRYCKILEKLGVETVEYEITDIDNPIPRCNKCIIASPTNTHYDYYRKQFLSYENILVEKPASHRAEVLYSMNCKMVCNWAFVFPDKILKPGKHLIHYDYHYTGKEGYWFDTCQLHILSNGRSAIKNESSKFYAQIDNYHVSQSMIEASYERMIKAWLETPELIWNVQDLIPELSYIIRKQEIENENKNIT